MEVSSKKYQTLFKNFSDIQSFKMNNFYSLIVKTVSKMNNIKVLILFNIIYCFV